ncbi:MAG: hypothetical protein ACK5JU_11880, partial [Bacteroidales bacterium]
MKTIHLPSRHIVLDIIGDAIHFVHISYNMIMKTCLPFKRNGMDVRIFRHSRFYPTYTNRQQPLAVGDCLHLGIFICRIRRRDV